MRSYERTSATGNRPVVESANLLAEKRMPNCDCAIAVSSSSTRPKLARLLSSGFDQRNQLLCRAIAHNFDSGQPE